MSADGNWAATGTWDGTGNERVCVWDAHTGLRVSSLPVPRDANVAFSPDGHWLVTASSAEFRFWEVGSWKPGYRLSVDTERFGLIAFSPDSRMVALSTGRSGVRLLDVAAMTELATLEDDGDERPLGFSPDGGSLATVGHGNTVRLWDLRRVREQLKEMGLDWPLPPLPPPATPRDVDLTAVVATQPAP